MGVAFIVFLSIIQIIAGAIGFWFGADFFVGAFAVLLLINSIFMMGFGLSFGTTIIIQIVITVIAVFASVWLRNNWGQKKEQKPIVKNHVELDVNDPRVKAVVAEAMTVVGDIVAAAPGILWLQIAAGQERSDRDLFEGDMSIVARPGSHSITFHLYNTDDINWLFRVASEKCNDPKNVWIIKKFGQSEYDSEIEAVHKFAKKYAHCLEKTGNYGVYHIPVSNPLQCNDGDDTAEQVVKLLHQEIATRYPKVITETAPNGFCNLSYKLPTR